MKVFPRILMAALALLVFVVQPAAAQARVKKTFTQPVPQVQTFVPNVGQNNVYVHFELTEPVASATPEAKKAAQDLKSQLAKYFHPEGRDDNGRNFAKCAIKVYQPDERDIPAYRLSCWSVNPSKNEGSYEKMGEAASPAAALEFNRQFAHEHFSRLRQSVPVKNDPPKPQSPSGPSRLT